jgi:hypothetical protein
MVWVRRILELAVVAAIVTLIVVNVRQKRELRDLRQALAYARRVHAGRLFEAGERFEGIGLIAPTGREIVSDESLPKGIKVIVVVDPDCESCSAPAHEVEDLRFRAPVPPIVISVGGAAQTAAFARRFHIDPVTFRLAPATSRTIARKLSGTPQILLVNDRSVIRSCSKVSDCVTAAILMQRQVPAGR